MINLGDHTRMYFAGARIQLLRAWVQIIINRTLTCVNLDLYSSFLLLIHQTLLIKAARLP